MLHSETTEPEPGLEGLAWRPWRPRRNSAREASRTSSTGLPADEAEDATLPLDPPPPTHPSIVAARKRQVAQIDALLKQCDDGLLQREMEILQDTEKSDAQPEEVATRRDFEMELRATGLSTVRQRIELLWDSPKGRPAAVPKITILCLLPVHIVTEERSRILKHTLRSIQQQRLPDSSVAEVILSISWYATDALAAEVSGMVNQLQLGHPLAGTEGLPLPSASAKVLSHDVWQIKQVLCRGQGHRTRAARVTRSGGRETRWHLCRIRQTQHNYEYRRVYPPPRKTQMHTVAVQHKERRSQFQHLGSALAVAERTLRERWAHQKASPHRDVFVMFGDDDDLWHPSRVATLVQEMRAHPHLEFVGLLATLSRAVVDSKELSPDETMPQTAADVDLLLKRGRASMISHEENSREWLRELRFAGKMRAHLLAPDGLNLEYFDFTPRLRVLKEFFTKTAVEVLSHRFCDLCLAEFLLRYNCSGDELGLETVFVQAQSWLYFYAHRGVKEEDWSEACNGSAEEACLPRAVGVADGHVSTHVSVEGPEVHLARAWYEGFRQYDPGMTPGQLSRYLAHFKFQAEMFLVRGHRQILDEREFNKIVSEGALFAFPAFIARLRSGEVDPAAEELMMTVCTGVAKSVAQRFEVRVLWVSDRLHSAEPKRQHETWGVVRPEDTWASFARCA